MLIKLKVDRSCTVDPLYPLVSVSGSLISNSKQLTIVCVEFDSEFNFIYHLKVYHLLSLEKLELFTKLLLYTVLG